MRPTAWPPCWRRTLVSDPSIDLSVAQHIHVVGVGGAGMSAIATVLAAMGHTVTGSDLKDSRAVARLRAAGITVAVGHDAGNVGPDVAAITVSTAIPGHNVEVRAAHDRQLPVLPRSNMLASIAAQRRTIAVAGTHGKTTTSSMLAVILLGADVQPSFIIGGDVNEIGTGAAWGSGEWFVVEADESDGTFLALPRHAAIVTNVEPDHIEHYGGVEALFAAFEQFVRETPGPCVVCADDPIAAGFADAIGAITYGTDPASHYRLVEVVTEPGSVSFGIDHEGARIVDVCLPMPGLHNARNAAAALVTAVELGIDPAVAAAALGRFAGVARRFEHRGEAAGVTFVDDYAHLPSEVRAALAAARDGGWKRVVCVFQPHRYSRTEALWADFAGAFGDADLLVVTDIYASGETPRPGVSGMLVANAVLDTHPWRRLAYLPHRLDQVAFLARELRAGDLCITLGAGDLTTLPDDLLDVLLDD